MPKLYRSLLIPVRTMEIGDNCFRLECWRIAKFWFRRL